MFFKSITLLLFATASLATQQQHHAVKRTDVTTSVPTATSTIDYGKVSAELQTLLGQMSVTQIVPSATETLAISIPSSLKYEIMTAVPFSVIIQLVNPVYRSSVASDFAAGSTPAWYATLDPSLKSFFQSMAKDIKTGNAIYTVTATPTPTATGAGAGAAGTDGPVATTSSSALGAVATSLGREMMTGMMALAGVAGVALVL